MERGGYLRDLVLNRNRGLLFRFRLGTDQAVGGQGWWVDDVIFSFAQSQCLTPTATSTVTPCMMSFSDVQPADYFYEAVRYLYCHGIISGYGDGTFRPYNLTTRAQFIKIVVLARGWNLYTPAAPTFRDVPADSPFYQYIETAYNHAIISGYNCGSGCLEFRPGNNVTRGQ